MTATAGMRRVKVLVVDDHDLFRTGLRALLEERGFEVADANSAAAGLKRLPTFAPDVVVMDMNMPETSGIEATRLVRSAAPGTPVLMLTVSTDDERVIDAIRAGAAGYLVKDAAMDEIAGAITSVASGEGAIASCVASVLLESVRTAEPPAPPARPEPLVALSSREREVLGLLSTGMENRDIAQRLFVSTSTVKHHVSRVLDKLGGVNRVQAATFAVLAGMQASRGGSELSGAPARLDAQQLA